MSANGACNCVLSNRWTNLPMNLKQRNIVIVTHVVFRGLAGVVRQQFIIWVAFVLLIPRSWSKNENLCVRENLDLFVFSGYHSKTFMNQETRKLTGPPGLASRHPSRSHQCRTCRTVPRSPGVFASVSSEGSWAMQICKKPNWSINSLKPCHAKPQNHKENTSVFLQSVLCFWWRQCKC